MPQQLTEAYGAISSEMRQDLVTQITGLWAALGEYRDRDIDWFIQQIVPQVKAGQIQMADLTAAYVRELAIGQGALTGDVRRPPATDLRGVPYEVVYARPAHTLWYELSQGKPFTEALAVAQRRLTSLVGTDLQMSKVRTAHGAMQATKFEAFRRVVKGSHTCALCLIASTQRYWKENLQPIHPGCDCDVEPYLGDPRDLVIDEDLLESVHNAVLDAGFEMDRSANATDYRKLVLVQEHGEYGPTLTFDKHLFTGPPEARSRILPDHKRKRPRR